MIDFLFSSVEGQCAALVEALTRFRGDSQLPKRCWQGSWGSLAAIGSAYPGFAPVETEMHVCVVLGGPLPRYDWSVATGSCADDGTQWILDRWITEGRIAWDEDLVGHFLVACVEKETGVLRLVTDINGFVSACMSEDISRHRLIAGSHADALAVAAGVKDDIDPVSVADFLVHTTVAYPHTMYEGVNQLPAASEITLKAGQRRSVSTYWTPQEREPSFTFDEAATCLRRTIEANVSRICWAQDAVGLLLSGGEDSRTVAAMVPDGTRVHAVTLADSYNREARVAEAVARRLGLEWRCIERSRTHYVDHAPESVQLVESHRFFIHAHLNGLSTALPAGKRCLGAVFPDSSFKAYWASTRALLGVSVAVLPNQVRKTKGYRIEAFEHSVAKEICARRERVYADLRRVRPNSWAEFASMMPYSSNPNFPHAVVARRLCFSYEPFVDAQAVKLAAAIPQTWKLNRRLFHRSMKPFLRKTWSIPHGNGTFPYFGAGVNASFLAVRRARQRTRSLVGRFIQGSHERNEGPWPSWNELVRLEEFEDLLGRAVKAASCADALHEALPVLREASETPAAMQELLRLQVLLWAGSLHGDYD